jgi:predicted DNA-binding transcriptional regulator YafY
MAVLLGYGGLVEVLGPAELRSRVAAAVRTAAALYDSG